MWHLHRSFIRIHLCVYELSDEGLLALSETQIEINGMLWLKRGETSTGSRKVTMKTSTSVR